MGGACMNKLMIDDPLNQSECSTHTEACPGKSTLRLGHLLLHSTTNRTRCKIKNTTNFTLLYHYGTML